MLRSGAFLDGLVVLAIGLVYVLLTPAAPHGDGLRWADSVERGLLELNPNHLLLQPIVLGIYSAVRGLGLDTDPVALHKALDTLAGCVTLFVLAAILRRRGHPTTVRALTLVTLAVTFNFLYLATSDHIKLLTAPFLALAIYGAVSFVAEARERWLVLTGVALAFSVATLVNAAVWAGALVLMLPLLAPRRSASLVRSHALLLLSFIAPVMLAFGLGYAWTDSSVGFMAWVSRYGSDPGGGVQQLQLPDLVAMARGGFAFMKTFVYSERIGPAVKALLSGADGRLDLDWRTVLNLVATVTLMASMAAAVLMAWMNRSRLDQTDRRILAVLLVMAVTFSAFGLAWNTAEEEFWFQTAMAVTLMIPFVLTRLRHTLALRVWAGVTLMILVNNLATFAVPRRLYPFDRFVGDLAAMVRDSDVVLHTGTDELVGLLWGVRRTLPIDVVPVTGLLERNGYDLQASLSDLDGRIDRALATGRRLVAIDLMEPRLDTYPWTWLLENFGYGPEPIVSLLRETLRDDPVEVAGHMIWIAGQ